MRQGTIANSSLLPGCCLLACICGQQWADCFHVVQHGGSEQRQGGPSEQETGLEVCACIAAVACLHLWAWQQCADCFHATLRCAVQDGGSEWQQGGSPGQTRRRKGKV